MIGIPLNPLLAKPIRASSTMSPMPPIDVPRPIRIRSAGILLRFLCSRSPSFKASFAAATASCEKRPRCRARAGSMKASGWKFKTSAATRQGKADASKREIGRTADFPAVKFSQNTSLPMPFGATTPSPVITTRRRCFISVRKLVVITNPFRAPPNIAAVSCAVPAVRFWAEF